MEGGIESVVVVGGDSRQPSPVHPGTLSAYIPGRCGLRILKYTLNLWDVPVDTITRHYITCLHPYLHRT